jgi:hypothetical protein
MTITFKQFFTEDLMTLEFLAKLINIQANKKPGRLWLNFYYDNSYFEGPVESAKMDTKSYIEVAYSRWDENENAFNPAVMFIFEEDKDGFYFGTDAEGRRALLFDKNRV